MTTDTVPELAACPTPITNEQLESAIRWLEWHTCLAAMDAIIGLEELRRIRRPSPPNKPAKSWAGELRRESHNVPVADTGDYDGVDVIVDSGGVKIFDVWNADEATIESLDALCFAANAVYGEK